MGRQLFLHHYLPAHLASSLVVGALVQFLFSRGFDGPVSPGVVAGRPAAPGARPRIVVKPRPHDQIPLRIAGAVMVVAFAGGFWWFAPLAYGTPGMSVEELTARKWLDTWDFHFMK